MLRCIIGLCRAENGLMPTIYPIVFSKLADRKRR
jgi:hypothetical protein